MQNTRAVARRLLDVGSIV